jgi:hypothetical protein
MTSLLAHAFMARDLLHEALGCTTAVVFRETQAADVLIVRCPLRPTMNVTTHLDLAIYFKDEDDKRPTCTAMLDPNEDRAHRTFKLSRNNLLGYLGLQSIPLLQRIDPALFLQANITGWFGDQVRKLVHFDWKDIGRHHATGPLHPESQEHDDRIRNPGSPYTRYILIDNTNGNAFSQDGWTYARRHPNGRDLDPHGPMSGLKSTAKLQAERDAINKGHFPVYQGKKTVLLWHSRWRLGGTTHSAYLTTGQHIDIEVVTEAHDDENLSEANISVTFRQHNHAEHGGTAFFDHSEEGMTQALHHALALIESISSISP